VCYFFTAVTHRRGPLFDDPRAVDMLFEAIARVQRRHPFSIDAHVVLPDHLHMIWSLPSNDTDFSTRW
jgi:putative transposase